MAPLETIDAHGARTTPTSVSAPSAHKSHWWQWLLGLVIIVGGLWLYRTHNSASDSAAAGPGTTAGGTKGAAGNRGALSVPVVVATATKGDLPVFYNGLGSVTAYNTVTVRSRIDGQLQKVAFTEGQLVKAGDVLAEIDPRPYQVQLDQAQGALAKDVAQRKDAEVNFERYKLLFKEGVIPKQQLDTQESSVNQFDGAIQTDQATIDNAKLNLVYCRITAPISGRVGLRLVDAGNMIHATDTNGLVVITQLQPIAVMFNLPQDQLPVVYTKLRAGQQLTVEAFDRDNSAKIAEGKLLTIDNQIDATTGTYKLKSVFSNTDNALFPNQFVNVHLLVNTLKNVVLVPTTAILRGSQGIYVYSVLPDKTVKIRNVTISETNGNVTGISSGLNPGDVVVTDGQDKLQEGSKVDPRTASAATKDSHPVNSANSPFASPSGAPSSGGGPAR
jgi:membrane fusion protein, multidrug efflux system